MEITNKLIKNKLTYKTELIKIDKTELLIG